MAKIKEALMDFNPWWKGEFKARFKEREIYQKIQKFLALPQIITLTGLRRVGKTTLIYKLVEDAIRKGADPKNIIYFSFDEFKEIEIRDILKEYESLMGKDFKNDNHWLLLDEIQKLNYWEEQLKSIYDLFGKKVKIIISGSESLFLRRKSKETLAGRIFEFKMETLTFQEFLWFKNIVFKPVNLYHKELSRLFEEFTLTQGFPELVGINDKEIIKKYVREGIIEKVIYRDIPGLFKVKDASIIEKILNLFSEEPGQLVEISELAKELKISRQTLSNYLSYLEDSFLVRKLYNFSKSRRKTERKLKKYYPSVVSPDLLFSEDNLPKSKVFEWQIVSQLNAGFFWRDPYQHEVDIILTNREIMPVEVKYGKIDFGGLIAFMNKFKVKEAIIISRDKEEKYTIEGREIKVIPAFKFLLDFEYTMEV
ncbi:MAG TPA: ATP-binding protein [Candidatus Nanoarchaeia archaeon]|nr:ATP-binding protein [Candidatus Nanoarchaeia archaeon]